MRKARSQGEGEHARARGSRAPTSTSRADPLGPSRRNGHLLLAPSTTSTSPARTGRHHLNTSTTSTKNCREITRELERERRRKKKKRKDERGKWGVASVLNQRPPRRNKSARRDNNHAAMPLGVTTMLRRPPPVQPQRAVKSRRPGTQNATADQVASTMYAPDTRQSRSDRKDTG
ncbi:hypothetical protein Taro_046774 [Colocasia esculenta]|uniref:Uncharacterized protein n=1 Tax=Colocasia esculenta TaxID=4460 RepID=A0A843WZJ5_COLES|nr:hypothetical protein [Colocasia esculenta]